MFLVWLNVVFSHHAICFLVLPVRLEGILCIKWCGLQRFIRENGRAELNVFQHPEFKLFRDSINCEMKRLILEGVREGFNCTLEV